MKARYLFEFCDQPWVPNGARECLYETMDACNSGLRSFNRQVAQTVTKMAHNHQLHTIVELGAGRAPITSELVKREDTVGIKIVACDLVPNLAAFRKLATDHPDRVFPIYTPVDLTQPQVALNDAVLVLAGVMHHIPFELRLKVIQTLFATNSQVTIFEPLLRTRLSIFLALLSFFPALLLPLTFFSRPGKMRRFLWCWIIPIAPYMFAWDGVVSCLRQWRMSEWQRVFATLPSQPHVEFHQGFNSLRMSWCGVGRNLDALTSIE